MREKEDGTHPKLVSQSHLAKIYNSVPNSTNININFHKIPNSTTLLNPHEIPNSTTLDQFANNNSIPRVIELFHNLTNPDLELQQKLIRSVRDSKRLFFFSFESGDEAIFFFSP